MRGLVVSGVLMLVLPKAEDAAAWKIVVESESEVIAAASAVRMARPASSLPPLALRTNLNSLAHGMYGRASAVHCRSLRRQVLLGADEGGQAGCRTEVRGGDLAWLHGK